MTVAVGSAPSLSVALLLCEDTLSFVDGVPDFLVVQSCCDLSVSYLSCSCFLFQECCEIAIYFL